MWFSYVVPYRWRWAHRWWSNFMAYWWLPCPVCGTEFSAHEWREQVDGLWGNEPETGLCICPLCARWGLGEYHQHEVVELELDLGGLEEDMRQLQGDQQRLRGDYLRAVGHVPPVS